MVQPTLMLLRGHRTFGEVLLPLEIGQENGVLQSGFSGGFFRLFGIGPGAGSQSFTIVENSHLVLSVVAGTFLVDHPDEKVRVSE
jgi:hypothetical protein